MKKATFAIFFLLVAAGAFLAGSWYNRRFAAEKHTSAGKVLYYVDPMHPAYRSDKPGIAPDCGMELVAVYDGGQAEAATDHVLMAAGTVEVSPEKQQLIGVRVRTVEKTSGSRQLRLFGRVAADETRIYTLNAGIEGYIQDVSAATTGSYVKKNELLATFSAPNSLMALQTFLLNLGAEDRFKRSAAEGSPEAQSLPAAAANIQQRLWQLQNLGMSSLQIEEIRSTRQVPASIKILSPVDGFVLARNVSRGQKFERGAEWYRVADLKRVWILADVPQNDAPYLRPGMSTRVRLPGQNKALAARVSEVLPQANPASGTLKVRFEAENPGYLLRPDMLVDAEVTVHLAPGIMVPADAVLDSGLNKTVFVERGAGFFEPREVKTGSRFDDRVEVVQGLAPGERIVVSGNFLLNSESRLKTAVAAAPMEREQRPAPGIRQADDSQRATDPACAMEVDKAIAAAAGRTSTYRKRTYYFCSDSCKRNFEGDADGYLKQVVVPGAQQVTRPDAHPPRSSANRGRHG